MVETEFLRPDTNHAPPVEDDDADGDGDEHCFGGKAVFLLDEPETAYAGGLSGDADNVEVDEFEAVVCDDRVLESSDDGHGCVEAVAEQEVADEVEETLAELPDLREGEAELFETCHDNVVGSGILTWSSVSP